MPCNAVIVFMADDEISHKAMDPDQPAKREPFQRDNLLLALAPTKEKALWSAEHAPLDWLSLTLWFERTSSRYMMVEAFAQIDKEEVDPILSITMKAA